MVFSGFNRTDLVNFPSNIAATVFVRGCNFRCPYCHNVSLVDPQAFTEERYTEEEIFEYLSQRKSFLDGVVVTGGEPTLYGDIPDFIKKVKEMGLLVKLDTNGTNPDMVAQLIDDNLLDYLAMDIKAPFNKYQPFIGNAVVDVESLLRQTLEILRKNKIPYEFRTTCPKSLLSIEDFGLIAKDLLDNEIWYLQEFIPHTTLDSTYGSEKSYTIAELDEIASCYKMARVRK